MRSNTLRSLHRAGKPVINAWLSISSPYVAELVVHQGFDAATVDLQHGMVGFEGAVGMFQAIATTGAIPLARPSENDPAQIMRLLDAARLVSACRYPPAGRRSFGPARGLLYGGADYFAGANAEILALAMIETREALENLDAILGTPGLDGVYIGPNDLAIDLGKVPSAEHDDPSVVQAVERIRQATNERGLIAGIFCSSGLAAARRIAEGFHLVTPGNDATLLRGAMASAMQAARAGST